MDDPVAFRENDDEDNEDEKGEGGLDQVKESSRASSR